MIERMEKGEMPAELAGTGTSGPSEEADQVWPHACLRVFLSHMSQKK
jgi:hypothetical protein